LTEMSDDGSTGDESKTDVEGTTEVETTNDNGIPNERTGSAEVAGSNSTGAVQSNEEAAATATLTPAMIVGLIVGLIDRAMQKLRDTKADQLNRRFEVEFRLQSPVKVDAKVSSNDTESSLKSLPMAACRETTCWTTPGKTKSGATCSPDTPRWKTIPEMVESGPLAVRLHTGISLLTRSSCVWLRAMVP